jgi:transposase-like protein
MVQQVTTVHCKFCGSDDVTRSGRTDSGNQRYKCRACSRTFSILATTPRLQDPQFVAQVLAAYQERASMRGVARIFGISRNTLADLLKKSNDAA